MTHRFFVLLTHVASQLARRWLPPPPSPLIDEEALDGAGDVFSLTHSDWRALISWWREREDVAWLEPFMRRFDPYGERWAQATYAHLSALRAAGGTLVTILDAQYPLALEAISDPPLALSLLGDIGLLQAPAVAVVGSRKASGLALRESFLLGQSLARRGVVTVSGGAFGCDIAAHLGVLTTGIVPAPAILVFAGGLANWLPRGNYYAFRRLRAARALFLSERLWQEGVRRQDFAARNRLIAGLAKTVYVMQAAKRSGALVTARLALDQGREVCVLSHPPGDVRAAGSAELLADGAAGLVSSLSIYESSQTLTQPGYWHHNC